MNGDTAENTVRRMLRASSSTFGDLTWCAAPRLWILLPRNLPERPGRGGVARIGSSVLTTSWRWRPQWWMRDGVLYASETLNQRRNLLPVCSDDDIDVRRELVGRIRPGLVPAVRAEADLRAILEEVPLAPGHRVAIFRLLRACGVYLGIMDRLLRQTKPRLVVVASQNQPSLRALTARARAREIPTAYIPHAPVATDPIYADLPYSLAALRGPGEVARYRSLGANETRLIDIGNPSLHLPDEPGTASHPPILAVSPWEEYDVSLDDVVELVRRATDEPVCVAPHPLSRLDVLRNAIPPHWSIYDGGRTFDLIAQVDAPVIQVSSGVGLEALLLGRKVVHLDFPGMDRLYPYIAEPYVACVDDDEQLRNVLSKPDTAELAKQRRDWARYWCSASGKDAVKNGREMLGFALNMDPHDVALDGWRN